MKIVCLSDTHGKFNEIFTPEADVLIHAGDWDAFYSKTIYSFIKWLDKQPQKHKIVVAGNHDKFAYQNRSLTRDMFKGHAYYLENESVEIEGVKFWGSPYTPRFGDWFFMAERGVDIRKYWEAIPEATDVLITHGPAYNRFDKVRYANGTPWGNVGCLDLKRRIEQIKPKVHICGHIHENFGSEQDKETLFINCALCDNYNQLTEKPVVFDMPR